MLDAAFISALDRFSLCLVGAEHRDGNYAAVNGVGFGINLAPNPVADPVHSNYNHDTSIDS